MLACRIDAWPLPREMMPDESKLDQYWLPALRTVGGKCLYIMTLGVLKPFRSRGLGSCLLHYALTWNKHCLQEALRVQAIVLHVHTENEKARLFYQRHGFVIHSSIVAHYYAKLPGDGHAYFLYHPPSV